MSDRAIRAATARCRAFGVHTLALRRRRGAIEVREVPLNPEAGTHSLVWDEAVKIAGCRCGFHSDAIVGGRLNRGHPAVLDRWAFRSSPMRERSVSPSTCLDPTKLVPRTGAGAFGGAPGARSHPDNFFGRPNRSPFCVANIVPGIDFSNDPAACRAASTPISTADPRLGGHELPELPINSPVVRCTNKQPRWH